jgi:hypothetical protein
MGRVCLGNSNALVKRDILRSPHLWDVLAGLVPAIHAAPQCKLPMFSTTVRRAVECFAFALG